MVIERELVDEGATAALARDVAVVLRAGDVLALHGPMGAGKTTFVRALAGAFGVEAGAVSSPTYVVMNVYESATGRAGIAHLDCSRLRGEEELEAIGWDRVVGGAGGDSEAARMVVVAEWAERIAGALTALASVGHLTLTPTGEWSRHGRLEVPEAWAERPGFGGLSARASVRCPVTGAVVPGDSPTWPFASERARLADLHGWLSERYTVSRPAEQADLE